MYTERDTEHEVLKERRKMNKELYGKIEAMKRNSAWGKGVKEQALEMVETAQVRSKRNWAKA